MTSAEDKLTAGFHIDDWQSFRENVARVLARMSNHQLDKMWNAYTDEFNDWKRGGDQFGVDYPTFRATNPGLLLLGWMIQTEETNRRNKRESNPNETGIHSGSEQGDG